MTASGPLSPAGASEAFTDAAALLTEPWPPVVLQFLASHDGVEFDTLETDLDADQSTLTDVLSALESHSLIDRIEVSHHPPTIEYVATERGAELAAVCEQLAEWCDSHHGDRQPVVLVADDEHDVAVMHSEWLEADYTVRTAYSGSETLDKLDRDVDIAVLDRVMPDYSGDEILDRIRAQGYDIRVVMVTAEPPNDDLLDMGFDEYLTKPVTREEVIETVDDLYERSEYDSQLQTFLSRKSKGELLQDADAAGVDDSESDDAADDESDTDDADPAEQ